MFLSGFHLLQLGLKRSHVEKIRSVSVTFLMSLVDSVCKLPRGFVTTTCRTELNLRILQSLKNFSSSLCAWKFLMITLSLTLRGGSFLMFSLSHLLLFFKISMA